MSRPHSAMSPQVTTSIGIRAPLAVIHRLVFVRIQSSISDPGWHREPRLDLDDAGQRVCRKSN
jgi:hypothetical protein